MLVTSRGCLRGLLLPRGQDPPSSVETVIGSYLGKDSCKGFGVLPGTLLGFTRSHVCTIHLSHEQHISVIHR